MDNKVTDNRFSHIVKDPRFKRAPAFDRKVKIDKRFQSMFTDDKFKVKYSVDKRGRPVNFTSNENLRKYYALSSDEDDDHEDTSDSDDDSPINGEDLRQKSSPGRTTEIIDDSAEGKEGDSGKLSSIEKNQEKVEKKRETRRTSNGFIVTDLSSGENASVVLKAQKEEISDKIKERLRNLDIDYARGESAILSDSSTDDESSDDSVTEFEEQMAHEWGELDKDAGTTDTATYRIAVCNMDWDRIRAADLMVLFSSFTPVEGFIKSITIYPSEYGLQRMKEEDVKGPIEIVSKDRDEEGKEGDEDQTEEGGSFHMEKLRKYQLNRLKYFYAVVECDSSATADKIYTECDGLEYESSAIRLDLRFIPDDMVFDQEPREVCTSVPNPSKYQPRHFVTKALQQAKVDCTWDETNPERAELAEKIMKSNGEVHDEDIKAYLASSSDESEVDEAGNQDADVDGNEEERISKYRDLIKDIQKREKAKSTRDVEMEVTWGIGLKEETEKLVKAKLKNKDELTPFEKYLEKRKEKRKLKKKEKKKMAAGTEEKAFSDDDLPSDVDLNDPYFKEELQGAKKTGKVKKKSRGAKHSDDSSDDEAKKKSRVDLELLLMDNETKNHFNLNDIMKQEKDAGKKKRRKGKKKEEEKPVVDDFQINTKDPRFDALYHSHLFNIDPADPHFKKTKAMDALVAEKMSRRTEKNTDDLKSSETSEPSGKHDAELSLLVKSVKRKAENMKAKKKPKIF